LPHWGLVQHIKVVQDQKKLYSRALKIIFSFLIFLVAFELGLRLIAPLYKITESRSSDSERRTIVILGESTSTDVITGNHRSWVTQLEELQNSQPGPKFNFVNLAQPGTTTTALVDKLNNFLKKDTPVLVISMMGLNDSPHFWYNRYFLIKNKNSIYYPKTLRLLSILWHYNDFKEPDFQNEEHEQAMVQMSPLDYPEPLNLVSRLAKADLHSTEYSKLLYSVETFLKPKSKTEKAQFYNFLSHLLRPPYGEAPEKFIKSYELMKLGIANDAVVNESLEIGLHYATFLNHKGECKTLVQMSLDQNVKISNVSIDRFMRCAPQEKEMINFILEKQKEHFEFNSSDKTATAENYQIIFDLLMDRNTCWIAMAYPREDLPEAATQFMSSGEFGKRYFTLENKEPFEEYLKANPYDSLFIDKLTEKFGHLSEKGAGFIAENAFKKIQQIKSEHLCGL
jgi:lysophospholipase L1-like esterase